MTFSSGNRDYEVVVTSGCHIIEESPVIEAAIEAQIRVNSINIDVNNANQKLSNIHNADKSVDVDKVWATTSEGAGWVDINLFDRAQDEDDPHVLTSQFTPVVEDVSDIKTHLDMLYEEKDKVEPLFSSKNSKTITIISGTKYAEKHVSLMSNIAVIPGSTLYFKTCKITSNVNSEELMKYGLYIDEVTEDGAMNRHSYENTFDSVLLGNDTVKVNLSIATSSKFTKNTSVRFDWDIAMYDKPMSMVNGIAIKDDVYIEDVANNTSDIGVMKNELSKMYNKDYSTPAGKVWGSTTAGAGWVNAYNSLSINEGKQGTYAISGVSTVYIYNNKSSETMITYAKSQPITNPNGSISPSIPVQQYVPANNYITLSLDKTSGYTINVGANNVYICTAKDMIDVFESIKSTKIDIDMKNKYFKSNERFVIEIPRGEKLVVDVIDDIEGQSPTLSIETTNGFIDLCQLEGHKRYIFEMQYNLIAINVQYAKSVFNLRIPGYEQLLEDGQHVYNIIESVGNVYDKIDNITALLSSVRDALKENDTDTASNLLDDFLN